MKTNRTLGLSNKQRNQRTMAEIYHNPPTGAAKIFHDALVREMQELTK